MFGKSAQASFNLRCKLRNLHRVVTKNSAQYRVIFLGPHPATESFDKGQIRSRCFVLVTTARQHDGTVDRCLNCDFTRESRLTRTRLSTQKHRVAVALSCATPQFACFSQLGNTAYQTATRKSVQNRN